MNEQTNIDILARGLVACCFLSIDIIGINGNVGNIGIVNKLATSVALSELYLRVE